MALVSRKGILAIAAVIDIALHAKDRPVSARDLAARNGLPPRHLEPVLQALVREGILRGIRGPGGGYELAGARRDITAESILRAAGTVDEEDDVLPTATSPLLASVVVPAVSQAEQIFCEALARVSIEDMVHRAEGMIKSKRK
jgi:Rrf2 family transcriptional regulator, iron-sulfur cluster assembly transcription factor